MSVLTIVPCVESGTGRPPSSIAAVGVSRIQGRRILGWDPFGGSYGTGGLGFFEVVLNSIDDWPIERLSFTVFASTQWLLLDDQWVAAPPDQYSSQLPLFAPSQRDAVTPTLFGAIISANYRTGVGDDHAGAGWDHPSAVGSERQTTFASICQRGTQSPEAQRQPLGDVDGYPMVLDRRDVSSRSLSSITHADPRSAKVWPLDSGNSGAVPGGTGRLSAGHDDRTRRPPRS